MIVNRTQSIFHSSRKNHSPPLEPLKRPPEVSTRIPCQVAFQPYNGVEDRWNNARKIFASKLNSAEIIININPFNDYDAAASTLPLSLHAASRGIPFVMIVPEKKLIPLPYFKELKNLQEACKDIEDIHFFHSDTEGIEAAIEKLIGHKTNIVFVEADFPHTTSSLNSKQPLASNTTNVTPDYNLESIYDCLYERLKDKVVDYFVVEHHSNTSAWNRFENANITNGLFVNDPPTGACWLLMQQLMPDNNFKEPNQSNPLKPLWDIHRRFAISAIVTDFYINCLNGQLNESSQLMIESGALEFPFVNELIELIKINPHLVNLIWSDRRDRRQIQSVIKENNFRKLHFLLARRLHDEGKKIIISNDSLIESVLSEVVGEYIEEFKASTSTHSEENSWLHIGAEHIDKLVFVCCKNVENIPMLAQNIINPLQTTINFWSSAFEEVPSADGFNFIKIAEGYLKQVTTDNSQFVIINEESYLGELLIQAFQDKDLSLDDLRRIIGRAITNFLKTRPENKRHITVVFPLGLGMSAAVSRTHGDDAPINSKTVIQEITEELEFVFGGGGIYGGVLVAKQVTNAFKRPLARIYHGQQSLTAVSQNQNIPTG